MNQTNRVDVMEFPARSVFHMFAVQRGLMSLYLDVYIRLRPSFLYGIG